MWDTDDHRNHRARPDLRGLTGVTSSQGETARPPVVAVLVTTAWVVFGEDRTFGEAGVDNHPGERATF